MTKNWNDDYDIFDPDYVKDPIPVWKEMRETCPIAHTDRWGGSWMPTKYKDVQDLVKMVPELSSKRPIVVPEAPVKDPENDIYGLAAPPVTCDPPEQIIIRRLILPFFNPKAVAKHRDHTTKVCNDLIDQLADEFDGSLDYAQQIPPRIIAHILGIDPNRGDDFLFWVRNVLELGLIEPDLRVKYRRVIREFFAQEIKKRRENPRDDMISHLLATGIDDITAIGMCNLILLAGVDTTWNSIGSAIWHLASYPDDRRRLIAEPELFPSAIEELLRFYSPVTMARLVTKEVNIGDATFKPGDKVLMNFPAANHDPEMFENPDEVILDREKNRHVAFGAGIHRCAGSNLARMIMDVSLRTLLERIPEFELSDPNAVKWVGGQVRGPRNILIRF